VIEAEPRMCVTSPCPERVRFGVLDSTLREGEQTPGVVFTVDQKIEIARMLDSIGVDMIEAGHPTVAPDVREAVRRIVGLKREGVIRAEVVAHSRALRRDIEDAAELEPDRVAIFYGVSDLHLRYKHRVTREEALSIIGEAVEYARQHGVRVRFTAEDATRADLGFLVEVAKTVYEAGADRLSIADTVGAATPPVMRRIVETIRASVPGLELDAHCHNDLGLALANSLAAVEGGASIVHVTVNGLGERTGITWLQQLAAASHVFYGKSPVNLADLMKLTSMVERYSGVMVPPNAPLVGDNAFTHKAGVHVAGVLSNPQTYEVIPPSLLGRTRSYTIDKYTGRKALKARLEELGVKLSDDELIKVLMEVKKASTARWISDEDLLDIVERVTGRRVKLQPSKGIEALVLVRCEPNIYTASVARRLTLIPCVTEVMEVTGDRDIVVRLTANNPVELNETIEAVRRVKGVTDTYTILVLRKLER